MSSTVSTRSPRRRAGRIVGRVVFGVLAGILVLATAAAFFLVWTVQRSFPQTSGSLALKGLQAQVTVQRDDRGIPTVTADSTHDLFFAQGFVHAQDRFWEMDFRRHVTSGRVAELFGSSQAGTDAFLRTLDWHGIAQQEVDAMDATTRGYYQAYADGVNAYLTDHKGAEASFEYAVLDLTAPRLLPRAVDSGRLRGVAEGDGLGPARQHRGRDDAGAAGPESRRRDHERDLPRLPVRHEPGDRPRDNPDGAGWWIGRFDRLSDRNLGDR